LFVPEGSHLGIETMHLLVKDQISKHDRHQFCRGLEASIVLQIQFCRNVWDINNVLGDDDLAGMGS